MFEKTTLKSLCDALEQYQKVTDLVLHDRQQLAALIGALKSNSGEMSRDIYRRIFSLSVDIQQNGRSQQSSNDAKALLLILKRHIPEEPPVPKQSVRPASVSPELPSPLSSVQGTDTIGMRRKLEQEKKALEINIQDTKAEIEVLKRALGEKKSAFILLKTNIVFTIKFKRDNEFLGLSAHKENTLKIRNLSKAYAKAETESEREKILQKATTKLWEYIPFATFFLTAAFKQRNEARKKAVTNYFKIASAAKAELKHVPSLESLSAKEAELLGIGGDISEKQGQINTLKRRIDAIEVQVKHIKRSCMSYTDLLKDRLQDAECEEAEPKAQSVPKGWISTPGSV